jgi:hypothetical protein
MARPNEYQNSLIQQNADQATELARYRCRITRQAQIIAIRDQQIQFLSNELQRVTGTVPQLPHVMIPKIIA